MEALTKSPLFLEGWLQFNHEKWGVRPLYRHWGGTGSGEPGLEAVLYVNEQGQVAMPMLNPYAAMHVSSAQAASPAKRNGQWLKDSELCVSELRKRGLQTPLLLPPEITDVRPWQWAGYRVEVRYTYCLDFPYGPEMAAKAVRNRRNKAVRDGYECRRTQDLGAVMNCLRMTEERQGFSHRLTEEDLWRLQELLGEDALRAYAVYAPDGEAACAQLILHRPGARALGWVAGGKIEHYRQGAGQLLEWQTIEDLQAVGAAGYDLVGANMPGVAAAKADWGGRLVPYFLVEAHSVKSQMRTLRDWWRSWRHGKGGGMYWCCTFFMERVMSGSELMLLV